MKIIIIAAVDKNLGIGKNNKLLAHIPNDLKQFKRITQGHNILMGRNTYDSIGRALPKRNNLVLSSQDISIPGATVVHSDIGIYSAVFHSSSDRLFIIGGASLYRRWIDRADELYISHIDHVFKADTFFPVIQENMWKIKHSEYHINTDEYDWDFVVYSRIKG